MSEHNWVPTEGATGIRGKHCQTCEVWTLESREANVRPCPGNARINVHIEADHALAVGEVWPDGDWPDEITAEAVRDVMEKSTSKHHLSTDWSLGFGVFASVGLGPEVEVWRGR